MSDGPLTHWRRIAEKVFPWLAHVRKATDKGLSFRTADGLLHLQGDAGDPAAARVGDGVGYFYVVVALPVVAVYWSPKNGSESTWTLFASGALPPVDGATSGTGIRIATGSGKVTIG